jgi:hypothetical protein
LQQTQKQTKEVKAEDKDKGDEGERKTKDDATTTSYNRMLLSQTKKCDMSTFANK